jgi:hypothetical protein
MVSDAFIHAGFNVMKTLRRSTPMGEREKQPFQLSFNASLKIDFQGSRVTSDGLILCVNWMNGWASANSSPST